MFASNLKQLIEVLHCDLQVTIHQGLVEIQADILKVIANFVNNFHIKVTTLSAPQAHALLDHMHARWAGSHSFWAAIRQGTILTKPESFLWSVPTQLLHSSLTDFQIIKPTLKVVQPDQPNWKVRLTISAKHFKPTW